MSASAASPRWLHFEPTVNLGHVLTIVTLLGGGASVYSGIASSLTGLALRVTMLENRQVGSDERRQKLAQHDSAIAELRVSIGEILASNNKMVEQLTGLRVDVAVLSKSTGENLQRAGKAIP